MKLLHPDKRHFVLASFAALALVPLVGGSFGVDLVTKIMVYAIFALSLELLVGSTGLVCFGQAAFFGIGAYADGAAGRQVRSRHRLLWLLPACMGGGGAVRAGRRRL
jgi:branched-chain amino acid transport system permease protein